MQLGISLEPMKWSAQDGDLILRTARKIESLGFGYALMSGHLLENQLGAALDPLVMLSAVAGATTSPRIASSVAVAPYYPPVLLANQAAALDVLSRGRFALAVGTGWNPDEFAAVGVPVPERGARTDEALRVLRELWSGRPVTLDGRFGSLRGAAGGVLPFTPGGRRCGSAGPATRHSSGPCGMPAAGTAGPATTGRSSRPGPAWPGSASRPAAIRPRSS